MKNKGILLSIKKYFKSLLSEDGDFSFTPIFLFIICVFLVIISLQLNFSNRYLKRIATNGITYKAETDTTTNSNDPFDVFTEESKTNQSDDMTSETISENTTLSSTSSVGNTSSAVQSTTNTSAQGTARTYVINKNSKKIHYPNCTYASNMKEENKLIVSTTPEQLKSDYIANGYTFCSKCGA